MPLAWGTLGTIDASSCGRADGERWGGFAGDHSAIVTDLLSDSLGAAGGGLPHIHRGGAAVRLRPNIFPQRVLIGRPEGGGKIGAIHRGE
eukprot:gene9172-biopygen3333